MIKTLRVYLRHTKQAFAYGYMLPTWWEARAASLGSEGRHEEALALIARKRKK